MNDKQLLDKIFEFVGGKENITAATNCMTRLRLDVKSDNEINEEELKKVEGVLGIVHDKANYIEVVVGPGKCRKLADMCQEMGIPASKVATDNDWQENKKAVKQNQKESKIKSMFKTFGEIFIPLLPGVIAAGLCAGIASLIAQVYPGYADHKVLVVIHTLLSLINQAMLAYLTAWAGYRAAEKFGGTPILGGMLGMITSLDGINVISQTIGLYNEAQPLDAILRAGRGGVLAVVIGAWVLVKVEKFIRKRMPDSLDIVFTPLLTLICTLVPYILIVMPATGFISTALVKIVEVVCMSSNPVVRVFAGFISSALFLPMVAMGMHHGLVALYTVQLEALGYVTLFPALAMAGAGQVGAAIAIYFKCKKTNNGSLKKVISGALPAGFLGIGEPLIYGVTLPMGKPFITAGIGAGFGGAFVMAMQVAATTWGPSGLLATFVMTAGPHGVTTTMIYYLIGLVISYVMGFIVTNIFVKDEEVSQA